MAEDIQGGYFRLELPGKRELRRTDFTPDGWKNIICQR